MFLHLLGNRYYCWLSTREKYECLQVGRFLDQFGIAQASLGSTGGGGGRGITFSSQLFHGAVRSVEEEAWERGLLLRSNFTINHLDGCSTHDHC